MDQIANHTIRAIIGVVTMFICWGMIGYLVRNGSPTNSLHESALSWGFTLIGVILIAFGLGAAIPTILDTIRGKPNGT